MYAPTTRFRRGAEGVEWALCCARSDIFPPEDTELLRIQTADPEQGSRRRGRRVTHGS
jgi:hypothetical protein